MINDEGKKYASIRTTSQRLCSGALDFLNLKTMGIEEDGKNFE